MITITDLDGKIVARSQNMRGILTYARKSGVKIVKWYKNDNGEGTAEFTFYDGSVAVTPYADWAVLAQFVQARYSWRYYIKLIKGPVSFQNAMSNYMWHYSAL